MARYHTSIMVTSITSFYFGLKSNIQKYVSDGLMKLLLSPEVLGPVLKIGPLLGASVMATSPGEKRALNKSSEQEAPTLCLD